MVPVLYPAFNAAKQRLESAPTLELECWFVPEQLAHIDFQRLSGTLKKVPHVTGRIGAILCEVPVRRTSHEQSLECVIRHNRRDRAERTGAPIGPGVGGGWRPGRPGRSSRHSGACSCYRAASAATCLWSQAPS